MLEAMFPDRKDFKVNTVGFTYKLTRKYSKFIFIYYIPRYSFQLHSKEESSSDIFSYSCLCVVSSWGSFLISPKVLPSSVLQRKLLSRWFPAESAFSSLYSFP